MELQNLKEVVNNIGKFPGVIQPIIRQAFDIGLQAVREHAKASHPPWPDKIFNPDGTWRYHNITRNLSNSINLRIRESGTVIEGEVGVLGEFVQGDALEYAEKMERDHPFIGPAVEAKKAVWLKNIENAVRKLLQ